MNKERREEYEKWVSDLLTRIRAIRTRKQYKDMSAWITTEAKRLNVIINERRDAHEKSEEYKTLNQKKHELYNEMEEIRRPFEAKRDELKSEADAYASEKVGSSKSEYDVLYEVKWTYYREREKPIEKAEEEATAKIEAVLDKLSEEEGKLWEEQVDSDSIVEKCDYLQRFNPHKTARWSRSDIDREMASVRIALPEPNHREPREPVKLLSVEDVKKLREQAIADARKKEVKP